MLFALALLPVGCTQPVGPAVIPQSTDLSDKRCEDLKAKRKQIRLGMRMTDVRKILGSPDTEEGGLLGITHVVYNKNCPSYYDRLILKVKENAVISIFPDPEGEG